LGGERPPLFENGLTTTLARAPGAVIFFIFIARNPLKSPDSEK
jgi:hypothetical protein